ncbi:MAG: two pore domain potassium channel family protein [Acholeplasmatales bacterium]|nr:two pore domain potassium channel family protein [Acholeplasmatales bacterium]
MKMKKMVEERDTIFLVINLIVAIVTMSLVFVLIGKIVDKDALGTTLFLGFALLFEAVYSLILFFRTKSKKEKLRLLVVAALLVVASVISFIASGNLLSIYIATLVVILDLIISRIFLIQKKKGKILNNITNILLLIVLVLFAASIAVSFKEPLILNMALVPAFILLFLAFKKLILPSINFEKVKVLIKILNATHTIDVIICLIALMISFSFIFPMVEETIPTFWDALWYCFAVITTIGFGDFAAVSIIGRVLTVILGIYGIVIVAIITSVIVNFYNEISTDNKKLKKLEDENKKD